MKRLIIAVCMLVTGIAISIGGYVNLKSICSNMSCSVNEVIRAIIDNWIDEIVGGLSTLIFIFNPAVIILGGGIMNEDYIISEIDKRIHSKDIRSFKTVQIKKAMLKNRAGMLGAAYLAKKNFDKLPKN